MTLVLEIATDFIKKHEALHKRRPDGQIESYPDPRVGWAVPTIGWGTTIYPNGVKVRRGDVRSVAQCEHYLEHFITKKCLPSLQSIPTWGQMNAQQHAALISFAFNLGPAFYRGVGFNSITRLCDSPLLWTNCRYVESVFVLYCNPGSNVEAGLKKRRKAEAALFCSVQAPPSPSLPAPDRIIALRDTFLKKAPVQSEFLAAERKVFVPKRKAYAINSHKPSIDGHEQVVLAFDAGTWLIFSEHWRRPWSS